MYNQVSNMYKNYNSKTSSPSYIIEDLLRQKYLVNTNNSAHSACWKVLFFRGKREDYISPGCGRGGAQLSSTTYCLLSIPRKNLLNPGNWTFVSCHTSPPWSSQNILWTGDSRKYKLIFSHYLFLIIPVISLVLILLGGRKSARNGIIILV